jgi:predicted RNase H-like nuclease (RuvC/YqgF family)
MIMGTELKGHVCDMPTVLRHERELGEMASITKQLTEQNADIVDTLREFNKTVNDLTLVISQQQRHIDSVQQISKEIGTLNNNIFKLETTISGLKQDISDRDKRIHKLEQSTSHIKWLNDGFRTVNSKMGIVVIAAVAITLLAQQNVFTKLLKVFGIEI